MKIKKLSVLGIAMAFTLVAGTLTVFATTAATSSPSADTNAATLAEEGIVSSAQTDEEQNEAFKKSMAAYKPYGLVLDETNGRLYYQGEKVRDFYDEEAGIGQSMTDGSIDLYAVYENGKLSGIKKLNQEEFDKNTADKEVLQKELDEKRKELNIPEGDSFSYSNDSANNDSATVSTSSIMSYIDDNGGIKISLDDGKTWISEAEYEKEFPTQKVVWWTYDEYKLWLKDEKKSLSSMIGAKGWNSNDGWFIWTQEKVNETIAMYEGILEDIKNGMKVSKTVDGKDDIMLSYSTNDSQTSTSSYGMAISKDNEDTQ